MCNSIELPEVEIISLLEEKLPVYKLRADSVYGYEHDDWLHTPLISPDTHIDLTAEQVEETLNYFCKYRRVTRTHDQSVRMIWKASGVSLRCSPQCWIHTLMNMYFWRRTPV